MQSSNRPFRDTIKSDPREIQETIQNVQKNAFAKVAARNNAEGEKFLAANAKKAGVKTTKSGLQYKVLKEGTGPSPKATDVVRTHYHGTFINGEVFDSSVERKEPAEFEVNGVIPGWTEALQLMKVGSKWQLFVPFKLAYGESDLVASGPTFASLMRRGERLIVEFANTGAGLEAHGKRLEGFALAGADGRFHWADAKIDGSKVVLSSDAVGEPVRVRYAWADNPDRANLYNAEGLPASPFEAGVSARRD